MTGKIMTRNYVLKLNKISYKVGDPELFHDITLRKGVSKKLSPKWTGPGNIVHKISEFLFKVRTRKSVVTVNHDRIKLCRDETLPSWMTKAKAESVTNNRGETDLCICEQLGGGGSMIVCGRCTRFTKNV